MTGVRAQNSMEIGACIKAKSLLEDFHREVCDIYGEIQKFHRSVYRWAAKLRPANKILKICKFYLDLKRENFRNLPVPSHKTKGYQILYVASFSGPSPKV